MGAVRDDDGFCAARDEGFRRQAAHLPRAEHHHLAILQVAENFLRQLHRHVADRGGAFLDRCLRADFFSDAEDFLEKFVQDRTGGSGFVRGLVGLLHLAEDFRLAEQHGVQPADDLAEMPRGIGLAVEVEGIHVAVDFFREAILQPSQSLRHVLGGEVELGAIAGGNDHAFRRARRFQQMPRGLTELGVAHGEALAHLDGRRFVIQS